MTSVRIANLLGIHPAVLVPFLESRRRDVLAVLPFVVAEIADATSMASMIKLCEQYGGCVCSLPKNTNHEFSVVTLLGRENAQKLIDRLGAGPVLIPSIHSISRALRPFICASFKAQGESVQAIARKLGITSRTVWRQLERARRAG